MIDAGYVTINPAVGRGKFNVVVMRPAAGSYHGSDAEYVVFRISPQMSKVEAEKLAQKWAAETRLERR